MRNAPSEIFDRVLNTFLCASIHYNEIEQAFTKQTFWKLEIGKFGVQNYPPVSLLVQKIFIEKDQRNKRAVFSCRGSLIVN